LRVNDNNNTPATHPFVTFVPIPAVPTTPINIERLAHELQSYTDRHTVNFLLNGLKNGFSLGCKISIHPCQPPNLQSALRLEAKVTAAFNKELTKKHISGPYNSPPFPNLHCSPVGAREKPDGSARIILDLSQPQNNSVNSGIARDEYSVQYSHFDDATNMIKEIGKGAFLSKVDIQSAFRLLPVKPSEWHMLGMRWKEKFFVDTHLPFGCRSSPFIFTVFSDSLEWILTHVKNVTHIKHYLDDFLNATPPTLALAIDQLNTIKTTFAELNVPIATDKLCGPTTKLTYLGIDIDTINMEISLPTDKLTELRKLIPKWIARDRCTKR